MIPWPSSCSCKHCETILNVLKKQDKEIEFLRNQSGHLLHMLKKQEREIESQHQKMNALLLWVSRPPPPPPEPAMEQANTNASPMYVSITNIHGHRFLNVKWMSYRKAPCHPHPSPEGKGKCEHIDNVDSNFFSMPLLTFEDFVGRIFISCRCQSFPRFRKWWMSTSKIAKRWDMWKYFCLNVCYILWVFESVLVMTHPWVTRPLDQSIYPMLVIRSMFKNWLNKCYEMIRHFLVNWLNQ